MRRVTYRSRKPFIGKKKRVYKRRIENELAMAGIVDESITRPEKNSPTTDHSVLPSEKSSASAKKLNAFGINIGLDHSDPTESEIDTKNCYFFAQATTLSSLICGLLCKIVRCQV